jgi:hypothetical protein
VAIQDAMGWFDCHLHEFTVVLDSKSGAIGRFGIPVDDMLRQPPVQPGWTVKVSDIVGRRDLPILHVYDFGDDWRIRTAAILWWALPRACNTPRVHRPTPQNGKHFRVKVCQVDASLGT